jgi:death-on-curing protein
MASLAAAYAYGIISNHPFRDGNKRVGFLTAVIFLNLNGRDLVVEEADVVATIVAAAAGHVSEGQLAKWIRRHMT